MKIVVWLLVVVGVYFIYQMTVAETFRSYEHCYDKAKQELANSTVSKSNQCSHERLVYEDMNSCVNAVQESGNFAGFLYQASKAQDNIEKDIETHNDDCPAYKLNAPIEAFYMSNRR